MQKFVPYTYGLFNWCLLVKSMAWGAVGEYHSPYLTDTYIEGHLCSQVEVVLNSSGHSQVYVFDSNHVGSHSRSGRGPVDRGFDWYCTRGQRYCKPAEVYIIVLLN